MASRVQQGGHNIPEAVIRRRFASGLRNFSHAYKLAVDDWVLYDNSGITPVMLVLGATAMTQADLSKAKNPKLRGSLAAMRRAADMARRTAIQTETGIVVVQGGKRVHINAEQLRAGKG